jgi:methylglutaconyl-CoA hydratase
MSAEAPLRCEVDGRGIARLTLDRPEKGNCYNQAMLEGLMAAVERAAADPAVRIVVVRGEGKHFCVGAEIGAPEPASSADRATIPGVCHALDTLGKPAIAFVHGACIGGGLALVASCDMVIASPDAFFSLPEVRLGFAPGPLIPFFLRAIEPRALRRYLLTGERFKADEALRIGLVHQVCAADAGDQALAKLIDEALLAGPGAVAQAKRLLRELAGRPISPVLTNELQREFDVMFKSPEAAEGRASFREKRPPSWYPGPAAKS